MGEVIRLITGKQRKGHKIPKPRRCDNCDELIATGRLQSRPKTRRCVTCQQATEDRRRRILEGAQDRDVVIIRG